MTRARRIAAEAVGTAFLLAAVAGSGIMGERLAGGNSLARAIAAKGRRGGRDFSSRRTEGNI